MFRKLLRKRRGRLISSQSPASRQLRFERCEDRLLLDGKADIVFLLDESSSAIDSSTQDWLTTLITGDTNRNGNNTDPEDTPSLTQKLTNLGVNDVRYGLIGFGQDYDPPTFPDRYAHSQLFDYTTGDPDSLFGDPTSPQSGPDDPPVNTADLNTIFNDNTSEFGGSEDG